MISISIPCLSSQSSIVGGILHQRVETRLTDLVAALESIEDGENGSRPRSPEQMRTALVSMLLSDNDLARCITAISRTVDDGAHEDIDAPAIAAIVDAVRVLARHPEWDEFAKGVRKVRDVVGVNPADVARETNTRALLCDAESKLAALLGQIATLTRERDEARADLDALRKSEQGDAPDGYRMLPLGVVLHEGDLVRLANDPNDPWEPTACAGDEYADPTVIYCRKITTPTPEAQA